MDSEVVFKEPGKVTTMAKEIEQRGQILQTYVSIYFYFTLKFLRICLRGAHRGRKRASDSVALELQVVVSHWTWVLATKLLNIITESLQP